ncbi:MAG TPA: Gfo/Idh/MocA family oxidoreductase [Phototrophicaceae bacterium]|nr:Gfo/Idh/MocA family oxidoreductase [Phototrophicaceae bacterium]
MTSPKGLRVALVGLGFGAEFVPIYLHHPDVASLTICDASEQKVNAIGDKFLVDQRTTDFQQILNSDEIDAVHLVTPIPLHAQQTLAVLEAGKHCACTVPMATSLDDLRAIVAAQRRSGKVYMGMETAVYTRRFLYAQEMQRSGALGRIQFVRGAHYQDMEGWPPYWLGLPPMHYGTHAVAPILALAGTRAKSVHCFGSGVMREELRQQYGNPYPIETAIFELESPTSLAAEVTRTLFHTARAYSESFTIYGEKATFEWEQVEGEEPVVFRMTPRAESERGSDISVERITPLDRPDLLPPEIARFTKRGVYDESNPHLSFLQGGGHDGSHPHLIHEFVRSIVEGRAPKLDAVTTANWNAPGICAHQSAMNGGARVEIPVFDR